MALKSHLCIPHPPLDKAHKLPVAAPHSRFSWCDDRFNGLKFPPHHRISSFSSLFPLCSRGRCECHGHADHCDTTATPYRCLCLPESHAQGDNASITMAVLVCADAGPRRGEAALSDKSHRSRSLFNIKMLTSRRVEERAHARTHARTLSHTYAGTRAQ